MLVALSIQGCSRPQSQEVVVFPDQFFSAGQHRYNSLIDEAVQQLEGNPGEPLATIKLAYACLRMMDVLAPLIQLYDQLQDRLEEQLALHEDLPNLGAGYHLQRALYWFSRGNRTRAALAMKKFRAALTRRQLPLVYQRLSSWLDSSYAIDPIPTTPVWNTTGPKKQPPALPPLTDAEIAFRQQLQQAAFPELWAFYQQKQGELLQPIFRELVQDTSRKAALKTVKKAFYNPFIYRELFQLYQQGLARAAASYLRVVKPAWVMSLDSTDRRAFFYLNLYLSESARWLPATSARVFLNIAALLAQDAFQNKLLLLHRQWLSGSLDVEPLLRNPFEKAASDQTGLLKVWGVWLASWQATPSVPESTLQRLHNRIINASPDEPSRNQTLALLGMLSCRLADPQWHLASQCLSPAFDRGYDRAAADPVKMAYLALAFFNDPLQMDAGKGLLEQLVKRYPILKPMRNDYIRLLSFLYAK